MLEGLDYLAGFRLGAAVLQRGAAADQSWQGPQLSLLGKPCALQHSVPAECKPDPGEFSCVAI